MLFFMRLIFFVLLASTSIAMAGNSSKNTQCTEVMETYKPLAEWLHRMAADQNGIGCPPESLNPSISKLETIVQNDKRCDMEAAGSLAAFHSIVSSHPYYADCGFDTKLYVLQAILPTTQPLCQGMTSDEASDCFGDLGRKVRLLREKGELGAAYKLATKAAESGDITGLGQMNLSAMYFHGFGTNKDLKKSIYWSEEALKMISHEKSRATLFLQLSISHQQLGDIENAKKYAHLCSLHENKYCTDGLKTPKQAH